jgi:hypothetical protein
MSDQAFFTDTYIRMMGAKDISAVYAIQQACYVPQMVEPEALIQQRWQQVADTSWVACDSAGPAAYLVAYRSLKNKVSALGKHFAMQSALTRCIYTTWLCIRLARQRDCRTLAGKCA